MPCSGSASSSELSSSAAKSSRPGNSYGMFEVSAEVRIREPSRGRNEGSPVSSSAGFDVKKWSCVRSNAVVSFSRRSRLHEKSYMKSGPKVKRGDCDKASYDEELTLFLLS